MARTALLIAIVGLIGLTMTLRGAGSPPVQGGGDELAAQVDLPDVDPPGMFDPPTTTELQDLAAFAESRDISLEEAVATYGWGRAFSQLVQETSARHGTSFAGAAIEQDGSAWIAFKGDIPVGLDALVGQFEREVLRPLGSSARIDLVPDRGFSDGELSSRVLRAHHAVYGQSPFVDEVNTEADPRTGEILMVVRSLNQDLERTEADVRSRLPDELNVVIRVLAPSTPQRRSRPN